MAKTSPDFVQRSAHYQDLARRKRDRERGLSSIRLERSRRRTELAAKDAALARQVASGERGETDGRRAADLASTLAAKYRLQVHSFAVSKQALDADVERLGQALAKAEAAWRAAERPVAGVAR